MKTNDCAPARLRFAVVSTCPEPWGGSEELWAQAATSLLEQGHSVSAFKTVVDARNPRIQQLKSLSCPVRDLRRPAHLPHRIITLLHFMFMALHLTIRRPDLVVISQGDNYDALHFGKLCDKLKLPYILISQKASQYFWPSDLSRKFRREVFKGALRCFFVSEHNRNLTEDQIGVRLTNAEVVRNPFLVPYHEPLQWPAGEMECLRLACVARLYLMDKGQDMLLRVLAKEKWRNRSVHVSFFGQGINRDGLSELAAKLGVSNVKFAGQTNDVTGIWKTHHALILPSRAEGLPLSLVEAMLCGRPAIVTKVGGNEEILDDGVTGFLAAPIEDSIDGALEQAWARRHELQQMGAMAAARVREMVPPNPAGSFAEILTAVAQRTREGRISDEALIN